MRHAAVFRVVDRVKVRFASSVTAVAFAAMLGTGCLEFNPDFIEESGGGGGDAADGSMDGTDGEDVGPCGEIPTFEDGLAPTAEIFVATDGADAAGCGASESPCASLSFAATLAGPGTAIRIRPGTYPGGGVLDGLQGNATAPIWIGGVPTEALPVFADDDVAFVLRAPRYVIVHDMEVRNMLLNGINIDDGDAFDDETAAQFVIVRDVDVHDVGQGDNNDCLKMSGVSDYVVLDSVFSNCGGAMAGSGVDQVGCRRGLVARNEFVDMPEAGHGIATKGGSEDVEIRWNRFKDAGTRAISLGGSTDPTLFRPSLDPGATNAEARNLRAVANLIEGSLAAVAFVGCVDCLAAHNTIVDPERWVMRILQETMSDATYTFAPASNGRFVNNLVYYTRGAVATVVNVGGGTSPDTFSFETNLWFSYDDPSQSDPSASLPVPETGGIYGQDPMVDDTDPFDVSTDSAPASAGTPVAGVVGDIEGQCYPMPPTIGAWSEL